MSTAAHPVTVTPFRVMISEDEATSTVFAGRKGFFPDFVFIRKDGWTLGAPKQFEHAAYELWEDEWTHFIAPGSIHIQPISEYRKDLP